MSTSLLYHAFGIRNYNYCKTEYKKGKVIFTIEHEPRSLECSECGSKEITLRGKKKRNFKTVPIGRKWVVSAHLISPLHAHIGSPFHSHNSEKWGGKYIYFFALKYPHTLINDLDSL